MSHAFMILGHRGSPRRFPENTRASFDEALRAGADGFETDLRLLSDRTAILYHDDELDGAEIESMSVADLTARGATIQKLADLAEYAPRTTMVLEVKRSKWEDVLIESVSSWPNVIIASFDHSILPELRRRGVKIPLGITTFGSIVDVATYAANLGAAWCFPNYRYVDRAMVDSLHERRIKVVPWTPNRPREWDALRAAGCDGVITDVPDQAVTWRRAKA